MTSLTPSLCQQIVKEAWQKLGAPGKPVTLQVTPEAVTRGLDSSMVMLPPEGHSLERAQAVDKRRRKETTGRERWGSRGSRRVPGSLLRSYVARAGPLCDVKDRYGSGPQQTAPSVHTHTPPTQLH